MCTDESNLAIQLREMHKDIIIFPVPFPSLWNDRNKLHVYSLIVVNARVGETLYLCQLSPVNNELLISPIVNLIVPDHADLSQVVQQVIDLVQAIGANLSRLALVLVANVLDYVMPT